jgi:hypothetical protein
MNFLNGPRYTEDELNARLKFFIGVILGLTLFGIVFVVLYSLIFVTQPMNGMSPVDNKFFELIIPIATFLVGTLSGIMLAGGDKNLREKALEASNKAPPPSPSPAPAFGVAPRQGFNASFNSGSGFNASVNVPFGSRNRFDQRADDEDLNVRRPMSMNEIPHFDAGINTGFGGRPAPVQPPQPEI